MTETVTDRGFRRVRWDDRSLKPCLLQESSAATEPSIWLGAAQGEGPMHLNQQQVEELLPYLEAFVATGKIAPLATEDDPEPEYDITE